MVKIVKGFSGVLALLLVIIIGVVFVELFSPNLRGVVTEAATDTETVTTGVAETTGTVTLATQHWFSDLTQLTVSCATDTAPTVALAANRTTVNLSGLTVSTVQVCTTNFLTEVSDQFANIVKIVPLLAALGIISAGFGAIGVGALAASGKTASAGGFSAGGSINMQSFIVAFVALLLISTVNDFTSSAVTEYANQPDFTGVSGILSLVDISYVLAAVSFMIGGGATAVRARRSKKK